MIAVRGKPYDAIVETNERVVAYLREQGVDAESATGGIPVVEQSEASLPALLLKGQQEAATSVLLLTANYASVQRIVLECYTPAGAKVWKVKVSGGTGWTGREDSKTGINYDLVDRFTEKMETRIGDSCLPVTLH